MKRLILSLLILCSLLPLSAMAEEPLPEGYALMDFGDFSLPIAPHAEVIRYDPETEEGYVAEIFYYDDAANLDFTPYLVIHRFPNNMSVYYKSVHPMDYGKALLQSWVESYQQQGYAVSDEQVVYSQRRSGELHCMLSAHVKKSSWFSFSVTDMDVWFYQCFYGSYEKGTYYFEVYAPTRAHADAIRADLDKIILQFD